MLMAHSWALLVVVPTLPAAAPFSGMPSALAAPPALVAPSWVRALLFHVVVRAVLVPAVVDVAGQQL